MSAATKVHHVSVDEYLANELVSSVKHEYLGGLAYAMAGAKNVHNLIAGNIFAVFHSMLRGGPCRPYNSDTKIRVKSTTHTRFYYRDTSIVCAENPPGDSFQDQPALVVEISSEKTRRIDHGEKKDAYLTIPSLHAYLLLEQDAAIATVYRRTEEGFVRESYEGTAAAIPLPELGMALRLGEAYEGVEFVPETTSSEEE
jgi:Uma2 family endonuclease